MAVECSVRAHIRGGHAFFYLLFSEILISLVRMGEGGEEGRGYLHICAHVLRSSTAKLRSLPFRLTKDEWRVIIAVNSRFRLFCMKRSRKNGCFLGFFLSLFFPFIFEFDLAGLFPASGIEVLSEIVSKLTRFHVRANVYFSIQSSASLLLFMDLLMIGTKSIVITGF